MKTPRQIVVATSNPGKLREIRAVLGSVGVELAGLEDFPGIAEPQEHGATFAENARAKAVYYSLATGWWCLADDSGLEVDALGGEPGVRIARYAADRVGAGALRDVIDAANNAKLLEGLAGVEDSRRTARFICHLALAEGQRVIVETFDTFEGFIARQPSGSNGFGYDPPFFLPDRGCTSAQLAPEEKNLISHRGKALRHFASLLKNILVGRAI